MSAVIDASVLVAALVDSDQDGQWAEAAIAQGQLAAPEVAMAEATNILRRMEQSGQVSRVVATASFRDLLRLDVELYPFAPLAERIWELRPNVTCYDAWYVALAEALNNPLFTLDRRLSKASGVQCEMVVPPVSHGGGGCGRRPYRCGHCLR
ncbi:MAG: type II toxin-antitoxin system VapC family toxin [bacterium]|nr:type II toxin-antitoxin system VapC family toxin [bacterium]MDE0238214.1 type II toxin-antitoxin system VapC family toxin [bacterium]